jgi:hypothetical protein
MKLRRRRREKFEREENINQNVHTSFECCVIGKRDAID